MTYTVVLLELSPAAYEEIKRRVTDAGQTDRIMRGGAIDMFEIAVCLKRVDALDPSKLTMSDVAAVCAPKFTMKCKPCGGYGYSSHAHGLPPLTCKYCKGSGRIPCDENGKEIK